MWKKTLAFLLTLCMILGVSASLSLEVIAGTQTEIVNRMDTDARVDTVNRVDTDARMDTDARVNTDALTDTETRVDTATQPEVSEDPIVPEGYSYYGEMVIDEDGTARYYVSKAMGDSGVAVGFWIDQYGNRLTEREDEEILQSVSEEKFYKVGSVSPDTDRENSPYPSSYDARDYGYVTAMEYQISGTCWAHATVAALETNAIKQGLADNRLNLNEYHVVWNCANGYYEGITDSLNDGYVAADLKAMLGNGGTPSKAGYALLNFSGAITETTMPVDSTGTSALIQEMQAEMTFDNKYDREITAAEIISVSSNERKIKEALLEYGGLYLAFAYVPGSICDVSPSGELITTIYTGGKAASSYHAVELIGWDDDFSVDNFGQTQKPKGNGAWLCKNSYGANWGSLGGYFWISYEESSIYGITAVRAISNDEIDHVFMYDGVGYSTSVTASAAANVFTTEEDVRLTKFSPGNANSQNYTLKIYRLGESWNDPTDGTLLYTQSGNFGGKRYADITGEVCLSAGDRFSIVIEGIKSCYTEGTSSSTRKFTSNENESFYYRDGVWYDAAKQTNASEAKCYNNVCIRAISSKHIEQDSYRVDFVCGKNRITKYSENGIVELPETEGYTWVFRYNGAEFDGTGVTHNMSVEAHCYPTSGAASKQSACVTEYRCIYCSQEMETAVENHHMLKANVLATNHSAGYLLDTCRDCSLKIYSNFNSPANATDYGYDRDLYWQLTDGILSLDGTEEDHGTANYDVLPWYKYKDQIREIYVNSNIKTVGSNYFYGYPATKVHLAEGLESIGTYAFGNMTKLESITFPDSLITISNYAFYGDSGLKNIVFGSNTETIGDFAFGECASLEEGIIPGSCEEIGNQIYYNCTGMKKITLEEGLYEIEKPVYGVSNPSKFSVKELVIPSTLEYMGSGFARSLYLYPTVTLSEENAYFCFEDDVLFNYEKTQLIAYPADKENAYYNVPDSVTYIRQYAFQSNPYLKYLELSCKATYLNSYCFYYCTALEEITLPLTIRTLYDKAFYYCGNVSSVYIPDSVITIQTFWITEQGGGYPDLYSSAYMEAAETYCDNKQTVYSCGHDAHTYDLVLSGAKPDCETDCYRILRCACGNTREFSGSHCYEWIVDQEANCGHTGLKHRECLICKDIQDAETVIPVQGRHSFVQRTGDSNTLISPATCTSKAVYCKICSKCGELDKTSTFTSGVLLDHSYTGTIRCNGNGTHCRQCLTCSTWGSASACQYAYQYTVDGTTCQESGYNHYACTVCGGTADVENGVYGPHKYILTKCRYCGERKETVVKKLVTQIRTYFSSLFSKIN